MTLISRIMSKSINSRGQIIINYGEDFTSEHTLIDRHGGKRDLVCTDYAYGGKELRLIKNQRRVKAHTAMHTFSLKSSSLSLVSTAETPPTCRQYAAISASIRETCLMRAGNEEEKRLDESDACENSSTLSSPWID